MVALTLREDILNILKEKGAMNTSQLAAETNASRQQVMEKLAIARRLGYVKDTFVYKELPWGGKVLTHVWMLTKKGEKWPKE